jgi:hypothetical protein
MGQIVIGEDATREVIRIAQAREAELAVFRDEVERLSAEVERYRPMADAADRVARMISVLGTDGREYVEFTEGEHAERVEAVRALWDVLEDY